MVKGLDLFRERFRDFQDSMVIIGGGARFVLDPPARCPPLCLHSVRHFSFVN
jgi:hypothetical protein